MALCIQAGTLAPSDLRGFQALVESAVLASRAYRMALKAGPIARGERGSKVSPWISAHARYGAMLDRFGLVPATARALPQQAPARGVALKAVGT